MKTFSALAIALIVACGAWGQTKRAPAKTRRAPNLTWKMFAPAGLGFRIQTPSKPHRIRDLYGDADPRGYKSIDVFGSRESSRIDPADQIIVLVPSEGMRKESGGRNDLGGLEVTIGGDDAEPSESQILVNGLNGEEFIYHLPDAEMLRHRRGRTIDAGKRVFVLTYATKTAAELNSRAAIRFFNSFKGMPLVNAGHVEQIVAPQRGWPLSQLVRAPMVGCNRRARSTPTFGSYALNQGGHMLYVRVVVTLMSPSVDVRVAAQRRPKVLQRHPDTVSGSMTCAETQAVRDQPPKDPNADPFGFGPWYINADRTIWAGWDVGSWVSGRKGNKVLWIRPQGTQLKITGRRLDADAPPLKARIPCCYPTGFQATRVWFPSAGCWEVTAKAGTSTLTFVAKIK